MIAKVIAVKTPMLLTDRYSPGAKLILPDDLHPEDLAMLQALYSRSAESVTAHLAKLKETGSGKFMESYFVNYGHKSIADCGSTTLFIEGVSLLAAKAIQNWPLYSGQETSTRYIDMSKQRVVDPVGTHASKMVLDNWMAFYTSHQQDVADTVRSRHPRLPEEKEDAYEGAVKARTFDILRGFLPAGITTQLSWHTNLRQAGDHLVGLTKHPSQEIRDIGNGLREVLDEAYPHSGFLKNLAGVSGLKQSEGAEARAVWEEKVAKTCTYNEVKDRRTGFDLDSDILTDHLDEVLEILAERPKGCVLPHFLGALGNIRTTGGLDFGSFRDLQRHRNGVCLMPMLTTEYGFEPWYLDQLSERTREKAWSFITHQIGEIERLTDDPVMKQYYTALGFRVPIGLSQGLPSFVYVVELRSNKTVHPTLRKLVHQMINAFRVVHPNVPLHVDMDPDSWTVRRGQQTITRKETT